MATLKKKPAAAVESMVAAPSQSHGPAYKKARDRSPDAALDQLWGSMEDKEKPRVKGAAPCQSLSAKDDTVEARQVSARVEGVAHTGDDGGSQRRGVASDNLDFFEFDDESKQVRARIELDEFEQELSGKQKKSKKDKKKKKKEKKHASSAHAVREPAVRSAVLK